MMGRQADIAIPTQFLSDYGGIDGASLFIDIPTIERIINRYQRTKLPGATACHYQYNIRGLQVVVYSFSVHRAVYVRLPDNANDETKNIYATAYAMACETAEQPYDLFDHNCVTAAAKILHCLHEGVQEKVWFPYYQFSGLDKLPGIVLVRHSAVLYQDEETSHLIGEFLANYQAQKKKFFSAHWDEHAIHSLPELYEHAMGMHTGSGQGTRETLISMGWVSQEENTGILVPTRSTPIIFEDVIEALQPLALIKYLSVEYKKQKGGVLSRLNLFYDQADLMDLLINLCERAHANPQGASYQTLKKLFEVINAGSALAGYFLSSNVDEFIDLVLGKNDPFLIITPRQFIFLMYSSVKDFSRVAIHIQSSEYMAAIKEELHRFKLQGITLSQDIIETLKDYLNFSGYALDGIQFSHCKMKGRNFFGARFTNVIFDHVVLEDVNFDSVEFESCQFIHCQINNCSFRWSNWSGSVFSQTTVARSDFSGSCSRICDDYSLGFYVCRLSENCFASVGFSNFKFCQCQLDQTDLSLIEISAQKNLEDCQISNTTCDSIVIKAGNDFKVIQFSETIFDYLNAHCHEWLPENKPVVAKSSEGGRSLLGLRHIFGLFQRPPVQVSLYPELEKRVSGFSALQSNGDRFFAILMATPADAAQEALFKCLVNYSGLERQGVVVPRSISSS